MAKDENDRLIMRARTKVRNVMLFGRDFRVICLLYGVYGCFSYPSLNEYLNVLYIFNSVITVYLIV